MNKPPEIPAQERFVSWKRIAQYLQCSERTARRWRNNEGLPVHNNTSAAQSSVFAYKSELDDWLRTRPAEVDPKFGSVESNQLSTILTSFLARLPRYSYLSIASILLALLTWWMFGSAGAIIFNDTFVQNRLLVKPFMFQGERSDNQGIMQSINDDFLVAFSEAGLDIVDASANPGSALTAEFSVSARLRDSPQRSELVVDVTGSNAVVLWTHRFTAKARDYDGLRAQAAAFVTSVLRCAFRWRSQDSAMSLHTFRLFVRACTAERKETTRINRTAFAEQIYKSAPDSPLTNVYLGGTMVQDALNNIRLTKEERKILLKRANHFIDRAFELSPDFPPAHVAKALSYPLVGNWAERELHWLKAIELGQATAPIVFLNYGALLHQVGRIDEAIGIYERLLAQAPQNVAARVQLAKALGDVGRVDDAFQEIARAIAENPDWGSAYTTQFELALYHGSPAALSAILKSDGYDKLKYDASVIECAKIFVNVRSKGAPTADIEPFCKSVSGSMKLRMLALLGEESRALAMFEQTKDTPELIMNLFARPYETLRKDQRFWSNARVIGLTRYWQAQHKPDFCFNDKATNCDVRL